MLLLAAALAAQSVAPPDTAALGRRALALLTSMTTEADAESRALAVAAWGEIGNPAVLPLVKKALKDKNVTVRIEAATALHKLGDSPAAWAALESVIVKSTASASRRAGGDPQRRMRDLARDKARAKAIARLSEFGGEEAAELFETTIEDPSQVVREATALALARMGLTEFADPFVAALEDKDESLRASAARSLGEIGRAEHLLALVKLMSDGSPIVRLEAAGALAGYKQREAAAALGAALKDEDARVRAKALQGLAKLDDPETTDLLKQALKAATAPEAALKAQAGLALRGETVDLGLAERTLVAKDGDLKALAVDVARAAGGPDALKLLARVMDEQADTRLKLAAAQGIVSVIQRRRS